MDVSYVHYNTLLFIHFLFHPVCDDLLSITVLRYGRLHLRG